jgi:hypothetical protein
MGASYSNGLPDLPANATKHNQILRSGVVFARGPSGGHIVPKFGNEIAVHPTADGHFVVFHDWTLECRTDGYGVTRQHTLTELKALDAGYGYTADGGKTFPIRGKGVGLIPSLDEVFAAFRGRRANRIESVGSWYRDNR